MDNAVADYKKAIELIPEHFDSYFNLGATFFNKGAEELNDANLIPTNKPDEYEAAKNKALNTLKEALRCL